MAASSLTDQTMHSTRRPGVQWYISTWLPPLVAVIVIAVESTDTFSSNNTSRWLRPLVERLLGPLADATWSAWHHVLRKAGHACGYGLVCLVFYRAWLRTFAGRVSTARGPWRFYCGALALLSTDLIASLDEWHQSFVASRTGNVADVGIDTVGALVSFVLAAAVFRLFPANDRGNVDSAL